MRGRWLLLGVVCLFGLIAESFGGETYTIKWRSSQVGDSQQIETVIAAEGRIKRIVVGDGEDEEEMPLDLLAGKLGAKELKVTWDQSYRDSVLGVQEGRVTSHCRRYEKINEESEEPTEHLIGKDVIIERRNNDYSFSWQDGPELLGKDAAWLRTEFEPVFDLPKRFGLPDKPVQIGEEWTFDARDFAQHYAEASKKCPVKIDRGGVMATGVLTRVYRRDGILCGVTRFKIRAPLAKATDRGEEESKKPTGQLPVYGEVPSRPAKDAPAKRQQGKLTGGAGKAADVAAGELILEITHDGPIDGSAGPWQSEERLRLPVSRSEKLGEDIDFAIRVELDMHVHVHTKTTPLP